MTAEEIRNELAFQHPIEHILTEIAAQLAEANQIARLRLQIDVLGPKEQYIEKAKAL